MDKLQSGEGAQSASGSYIAQAQGPGAQAAVNVYQVAPPAPVDSATLDAAQQRLATLPLDTIPASATLPTGSRMPFRANPLFVGREDDFKTLAQTLKGGQTTAIGQIAAATGLGGIGKTQLASEFVHRYGHYFAGGVFWLSLADAAGVRAEVANCGGAGGLELRPDYGQLKLDEQVQLVLSAWQSPLPRLLVFDNCEDESLLAQWRPPTGGCRVLVTSRRGQWSASLGVAALPLGVLSRPESIALLVKHRPDLAADDPDLDAIAEELGDLPLALHLAGSFLETYRDDPQFGRPADFLAELRDSRLLNHPALQGQDVTPSPTNHFLHVGRTFALSYHKLTADNPVDVLAGQLVGRAAYFAPGIPIPRELLLATLNMATDDRAAARQAAQALNRLVNLGLLVSGEAGALTLHRLLATFVQTVTVDSAVAQAAVEKTLLAKSERINQAGDPRPLLTWQAHLRAVTDVAQARGDERGAGLCNTLGVHLWMIGDYVRARPYLEQALVIWEKVLGPEHPDTATSVNNLAVLLQASGDLTGARSHYERALAIWEKVLGPKHPKTATSLNNLGALLYASGDLAGARPYFERTVMIWEKVLGAEHPDTAASLNNLGMLLYESGDLTRARPYLERVLALRKKILGSEHPNTALSLNNLGALLYASGDLAGARPHYERALAIREKVLGPEHPDTAQSLNNLGALLRASGDLAGARPYYERALAIREKVLGPKHPDTAQSLNNLGALLRASGDLTGARPYYERALAIREKVLGPEHPDTAQSLNNLGDLLQDIGDLAGIRPYYERALAIREKVLGPEHPDTAGSLNNLGALLQDMGDLAGARFYHERALTIREKVLGPEHPDTANSLHNLGALMQASGDLAGARSYYKRALVICETWLGPDHPNTRMVRRNLATLNQK